jgi:hypothetical protein
MTKKINDLLKGLEAEAMSNVIPPDVETLQKEVVRLRKTLETYGITQEAHVTNIEFICQKGIDNLKKILQSGTFTQDEAKTLDILHKNLRMARGKLDKKETPGQKATEAELLKIVENEK